MNKVIIFAAVLGVIGAAMLYLLLFAKFAQKMFSRKKNKEISK